MSAPGSPGAVRWAAGRFCHLQEKQALSLGCTRLPTDRRALGRGSWAKGVGPRTLAHTSAALLEISGEPPFATWSLLLTPGQHLSGFQGRHPHLIHDPLRNAAGFPEAPASLSLSVPSGVSAVSEGAGRGARPGPVQRCTSCPQSQVTIGLERCRQERAEDAHLGRCSCCRRWNRLPAPSQPGRRLCLWSGGPRGSSGCQNHLETRLDTWKPTPCRAKGSFSFKEMGVCDPHHVSCGAFITC